MISEIYVPVISIFDPAEIGTGCSLLVAEIPGVSSIPRVFVGFYWPVVFAISGELPLGINKLGFDVGSVPVPGKSSD